MEDYLGGVGDLSFFLSCNFNFIMLLFLSLACIFFIFFFLRGDVSF